MWQVEGGQWRMILRGRNGSIGGESQAKNENITWGEWGKLSHDEKSIFLRKPQVWLQIHVLGVKGRLA